VFADLDFRIGAANLVLAVFSEFLGVNFAIIEAEIPALTLDKMVQQPQQNTTEKHIKTGLDRFQQNDLQNQIGAHMKLPDKLAEY